MVSFSYYGMEGIQMEFSREKIRQIRRLMLLAAFLVLVLIYSEVVFQGIAFLWGILSPFLVGGASC